MNHQPLEQFLTVEESAAVDKALLSSTEKFSTRLAIYALRSLNEITKQTGSDIAAIDANTIQAWMTQDQTIQHQIDLDRDFETFFTRLILSSLKPLQQIQQETGIGIQDLTVEQVVAWFEKEAKMRRQATSEEASLELKNSGKSKT